MQRLHISAELRRFSFFSSLGILSSILAYAVSKVIDINATRSCPIVICSIFTIKPTTHTIRPDLVWSPVIGVLEGGGLAMCLRWYGVKISTVFDGGINHKRVAGLKR